MAFNWKTFRIRTISSIVFMMLMAVGVLWNHWSFLLLFSIIHFGCWWEYLKLVEKIQKTFFHPYVKIGFMVIGYGLMLWFCGPVYKLDGYGLKENLSLPVSGAGFAVMLAGIFQKTRIRLKSFGAAALGLLYISLSWGLMMDLADEVSYTARLLAPQTQLTFKPFSYMAVLFPCVIIVSLWINDSMAYMVGSLIGKTPLTKISPKKTWEGTLGGMLLAIAAVGFLFYSIPTDIILPGGHMHIAGKTWFIIVAIASVFGTLGDILESKLKRMAGVKDSGFLMPGHGGFLDRFDSLLIATPAVWLYLAFFI
ncbi:MAG TPA: phosphatidate cytidylyltransferase [Chitinophagaceae bacterium]|nr:phosphatidate cytidylyltransferase [Chitinophagaceae bacterium]